MTSPPARAITPRPKPVDPRAGAAFDAVAAGRAFLHQSRIAALSTLDPGGFPYGIITNVMPDADGSPVFFAARIALHARNLLADSRASLAWGEFGQADMLTRPRMTLVGHARPVPVEEEARLRARYLERFPKARLYLALPDALLFRLEVSGVTLGGGPARNAGALSFADLRHKTEGAEALIAEEPALLAALNADRGVTGALIAGPQTGPHSGPTTRAARWRIVSLDPDGLDLASGARLQRVSFGARVTSPADLRREIDALTGAARGQ